MHYCRIRHQSVVGLLADMPLSMYRTAWDGLRKKLTLSLVLLVGRPGTVWDSLKLRFLYILNGNSVCYEKAFDFFCEYFFCERDFLSPECPRGGVAPVELKVP